MTRQFNLLSSLLVTIWLNQHLVDWTVILTANAYYLFLLVLPILRPSIEFHEVLCGYSKTFKVVLNNFKEKKPNESLESIEFENYSGL